MIRGVFVLGEQGNMLYSKEYAKGDSKANLVEFLINLTHFLISLVQTWLPKSDSVSSTSCSQTEIPIDRAFRVLDLVEMHQGRVASRDCLFLCFSIRITRGASSIDTYRMTIIVLNME